MKKLISLLLTVALLTAPLGVVFASAIVASAPEISSSIGFNDFVTPTTVIQVNYSSSGTLTSCLTKLEGTVVSSDSTVSLSAGELFGTKYGTYTFTMEATDSAGQTARDIVKINYVPFADIGFRYADDESIVPSEEGATAKYHEITPLEYKVGYGSTSDGSVALSDTLYYSDYDVYNLQYMSVPLHESSVSGMPYNLFDVSLNGMTEGNIVLRYTGATYGSERIALKVYNPSTSDWDKVGVIYGSDSISVELDVAKYNDNDVIHAMAILDNVTNGSDTMIWSTDPQHYTKFADLNEYYYKIYQYAADEYVAGNIGYVITTGDLVDDLPKTSVAAGQWVVADTAMSLLEEVGVPNGLVSGNHDVGTFSKPDYSAGEANVDYSKYLQYFNASRYNASDWYGGSLNNNISHYDLITIGNVDFVVLYLGYGVEATEETIEWATDVLERYSHRIGIVATHEYLEASSADRSVNSRAQLIYDEIIDPNPNVKIMLCGHDDGSIVNEVTASDGRTVYEILSDYQFVEAEDDDFYANEHYIGSVPSCCGDGYIRLMTVKGNTLSSITYSPVTGRNNPYGDRESFSISLGDYVPDRHIETVTFSAYVVGEETDAASESATAIVITGASGTTYHHASYADYPAMPEPGETRSDVDLSALNALLADARAINTSGCTSASVAALNTAISNAEGASDVKAAYVALAAAVGALEKQKAVIDASTLESAYVYTMTTSNWSTSDVAMTQVGSAGIHMTRAAGNTNGWASIRYKGGSYTIKPNNGKIYMNLDIDADSAWCIYIEATQGSSSAVLRMNFAIDNAFHNTTADSYNGDYKGVYDVTEAFVAAGFDPNSTVTITGTALFIVPGDVTYYHVEYMTGKSDGSNDFSKLTSAINSAKALNKSLYTTASWTKLSTALTSAETVAKNSSAHQADVNLAVLELNKAVSALKLLSDLVAEPEGSLLPADEGKWAPNITGAMNIYRDDSNVTVLQNTNGQWPYADYVLETPITASVADQQISVDITVAGKTNIYFFTPDIGQNGTWVPLPKYISSSKTDNAGDLTAGTYTTDIRLSDMTQLAGKESITITKTRIYAVGTSGAGSAVTVRKLQVTDYIAPPKVEDKKYDILANAENFTVVSGDGTAEIKNGVLTIVNNGDGDFRVSFSTSALYNLNKLNTLHLDVDTDIPFKIALQAQASNGTAAWQNTSAEVYGKLFTIENDRVVAGSYDTYMELRDNTAGITDKSSVYYNTFIVLATGKGTFKLNLAEAVAYDTFEWPVGPSYGRPATPDENYFAHAATTAPEVENMVDLIPYFNSGTHPTVGSSTIETINGLGLDIDISKTPYLYYSFAVCDGADFTFSLYSNSTYSPWLSFLDSNVGNAVLNKTAGVWDGYTSRQQYSKVSQTGCIDMRQYLVDPNVQKWVINQMKLYKPLTGTAVVSYLFFGSECLTEYPPVDESDDVSEDTSSDVSTDTSDESEDSFVWPEGPSYGRPATPDDNYFAHAATDAPEVENKVDLIPYFNAGEHPTVSSAELLTAGGLGIDVDLSKTPYLYYSFAVCDGADFTFSFYSDSTYAPWLTFLDANIGDAVMNSTNANWESYKAREQFSKVSQTGCIDMRQYLTNPEVQKWVINQMKLYKPLTGTAVVSYLFFGSECLTEYPPVEDSSDDSSEDSSDDSGDDSSDVVEDYDIGDVDGSGEIDQFDYLLVKGAYFNTYALDPQQKKAADIDGNGQIDQFDYLCIKRAYFNTYTIE